jgi:hypothetical protein
MDQRVWLAAFGAVSVHQPRIDKEESVEGESECGVMGRVAQRKEATDEHRAKDHGAEDDKFSMIWCHVPFLPVLYEVVGS